MKIKKIAKTSLILPITSEFIERRIYVVRSVKVMLSTDLAELYQVEPRVLIQAVKRNQERFPDDFMFQLTLNEATFLKSQIVISKKGRGGRRHSPYAFTELGVAMLSSVLSSDRAVQMNVFIMRAFVHLRRLVAENKGLSGRMDQLELDQIKQGNALTKVYDQVKRFMDTPLPEKGKMGFDRNFE